jgi:hypothetical protein
MSVRNFGLSFSHRGAIRPMGWGALPKFPPKPRLRSQRTIQVCFKDWAILSMVR